MTHKNNKPCELLDLNGSETLIVCFGGLYLKMGGVPPFEFLNFLSKTYNKKYDYAFYVDLLQQSTQQILRYHKGLIGISSNIEETSEYLKQLIKNGNYKKVIFMGISGGGYAAILFGSLCDVTKVIAFIPRVVCPEESSPVVDQKYSDLRNFINDTTIYFLYGDMSVSDKNDSHHISQCEYLEQFKNIILFRKNNINMKEMKNNGELKRILDRAINC
jgi:predicted esterase YcpF (UPF0227 family)